MCVIVKGIVKFFKNGMFFIETEKNYYSVVETFGDDLEIGETVSWGYNYKIGGMFLPGDDHPLGSDYLKIDSSGIKIEVFFQDHEVFIKQE